MENREKILDQDFAAALEHLGSGHLASATLFALSDVNRAELQSFAGTWEQLPAERRRQIVQAMADLAEENIEVDYNRLFRHMLDDEDPQVRECAIGGLWEDEDAALINPLIGALRSDAAALVRAAAAEGLGRFLFLSETKRLPPERGEQIAEALLAAIRSPGEDVSVRRRAIESIAYLGTETVRDIIVSAYAEEDAEMCATALFAMGRSADPYWRKTVMQELYSSIPEVRYEAARAAGELECKPAVPKLVELLDDPDREVQSACITALGQLGGKLAKEALVRVAESDDEVNAEIARDALDELEFTDGSQLLLYDMDVAGADAGGTDEDIAIDEPDEDDQADEDQDGDIEDEEFAADDLEDLDEEE